MDTDSKDRAHQTLILFKVGSYQAGEDDKIE